MADSTEVMQVNTKVIYLVEYDELPSLAFNTGTNLSNFVGVVMRVRLDDLTRQVITGTIDDAATGDYSFALPMGGFPAGTHTFDIRFATAGGMEVSLKNTRNFTMVVRSRS